MVRKLFDYLIIITGSFIMASGYVFFINPYNIVPGGVFGIGITVHHLFPIIPVGTFGLLVNIPLTLIGMKILGTKFGLKTAVGIFSTSIFMDGLTLIVGETDPLHIADDLLLSSIFGGIIIGLGLGIIFRAKATTGGSDIVAMILGKFTKYPVGQLLIIVDSIIVIIGLIVFKDWKIPLYSWITIFITGKVLDIVLEGINYDKALIIISDKHNEIKPFILNDLNRGGTYLNGEGMYTGNNKKVILTVITRRELIWLESKIYEIDPHAFIAIISTHEILGEGFKSLNDKIKNKT